MVQMMQVSKLSGHDSSPAKRTISQGAKKKVHKIILWVGLIGSEMFIVLVQDVVIQHHSIIALPAPLLLLQRERRSATVER